MGFADNIDVEGVLEDRGLIEEITKKVAEALDGKELAKVVKGAVIENKSKPLGRKAAQGRENRGSGGNGSMRDLIIEELVDSMKKNKAMVQSISKQLAHVIETNAEIKGGVTSRMMSDKKFVRKVIRQAVKTYEAGR